MSDPPDTATCRDVGEFADLGTGRLTPAVIALNHADRALADLAVAAVLEPGSTRSPYELAANTGLNLDQARLVLHRLAKRKSVRRVARGRYQLERHYLGATAWRIRRKLTGQQTLGRST